MKALIGTRKSTILLQLAIALALTGSTHRDDATASLPRNARVCFVIDGQIYCVPGTGKSSSSVRAWLRPR